MAVVPRNIWKVAQNAENQLWSHAGGNDPANANDRASEHVEGFKSFEGITKGADLGDLIEIGAGPWTQLRSILSTRPDLIVRSYTIREPGADFYMKTVKSCAYSTGRLHKFHEEKKYHDFPVHIISSQGEFRNHQQYDTLVVINVIEHVQRYTLRTNTF